MQLNPKGSRLKSMVRWLRNGEEGFPLEGAAGRTAGRAGPSGGAGGIRGCGSLGAGVRWGSGAWVKYEKGLHS